MGELEGIHFIQIGVFISKRDYIAPDIGTELIAVTNNKTEGIELEILKSIENKLHKAKIDLVDIE